MKGFSCQAAILILLSAAILILLSAAGFAGATPANTAGDAGTSQRQSRSTGTKKRALKKALELNMTDRLSASEEVVLDPALNASVDASVDAAGKEDELTGDFDDLTNGYCLLNKLDEVQELSLIHI